MYFCYFSLCWFIIGLVPGCPSVLCMRDTPRRTNKGKMWEQVTFFYKCLQISAYRIISIHSKSGSPGSPDSANYLNFPQNYSLRTRKLPTLLCWILSQGAKAVKMCQSVVDYAINVWQTCSWFQTHFSATFLGLFNDLRTFVARFWCRDLRTFSANCLWLKKQTPQTFSLLECMYNSRAMFISSHHHILPYNIESLDIL